MRGRAEFVIGIDPGAASGAIAKLNINNPEDVEFFDLPSIQYMSKSGRKYRRLDDNKTLSLIQNLSGPGIICFVVETQSGYGLIPGSAKFGLGDVFGFLRAAILSAKMDLEQVKSQTWKKFFRLKKTDNMSSTQFKELSRLKAIKLFPNTREALRLRQSHNKAEALLLCEYARRKILRKYI